MRLACAVPSILVLAVLWQPASAQDSLTIHHIDVDQGDATLFVMPNGQTLLVDSGLTSRGDTVAQFLQTHGITQLDAFVATHYDVDHYGGIPKVVEAGIEVTKWYDRGEKAFVDGGIQDPTIRESTHNSFVGWRTPHRSLSPTKRRADCEL